MTTAIEIRGRGNGGVLLKNRVSTAESRVETLPFGGFIVVFDTKRDAVDALSKAFRGLRAEEPECFDGIRSNYSYRRGQHLQYDGVFAKLKTKRQ